MFLLLNLGGKLASHRDYIRAKMVRDEDGVTAMEYGLIAALIAIVIILALTFAGEALEAIFAQVSCVLGGGTWDGTAEGSVQADGSDPRCTAAE